jgi:hypothetical protein
VPASTRTVRVVVQHTKDYKGWSYRLIAYDDARTYLPVRFDSKEDLVEFIRRVVPDFAASRLAVEENAGRSYVTFSGDWDLNDGVLFLLGLNPAS